MILKLDLSKAFDKLSWTYIQKMLTAFGFSPMWVRWIMSLISSTFFSILINGSLPVLSVPPEALGKETLSPHSSLC